jgi:hypothetical protein
MFSPKLLNCGEEERLDYRPSSACAPNRTRHPIHGPTVPRKRPACAYSRTRLRFGPHAVSLRLRQGSRSTLRSRCTLTRYATRIYALTPGNSNSVADTHNPGCYKGSEGFSKTLASNSKTSPKTPNAPAGTTSPGSANYLIRTKNNVLTEIACHPSGLAVPRRPLPSAVSYHPSAA